jgi:hypothetical protein
MAVRSLAFGVRLNDRGRGRTVRVRRSNGSARGYVLEERDADRGTRRRDHVSLEAALRDLASSWRSPARPARSGAKTALIQPACGSFPREFPTPAKKTISSAVALPFPRAAPERPVSRQSSCDLRTLEI